MSRDLVDFSQANQWIQLYNQQFQAQRISPKAYIPLQPVPIPIQADHRFLAAGCTSTSARPSWNLGGWLTPSFDSGRGDLGDVGLGRLGVPLKGKKLLVLPQYSTAYKLLFEVPYWIEDVNLTIFQYVGTEGDSTEALIVQALASLAAIQAKLNS